MTTIRICALTFAVLMAHPAQASSPTAWEAYEETLGKADAAARKGEIPRAVETYAAAYGLLSEGDRLAAVGEGVVREVIRLVNAEWKRGVRDPQMVERALTLVTSHLDNIHEARRGQDTSSLADDRAELEWRLSRMQPQQQPPTVAPQSQPASTPPAEPEPAPPPPTSLQPSETDRTATSVPPAAPPTDDRNPRLAIGLLAGGSVALVGGVALLAIGGAFQGTFEQKYDERCPGREPSCVDELGSWPEDQLRKRNALFISGGVLAAAGAGVLAAGAVVYVRGKKGDTTASLSLSPTFASGPFLLARGRF